MCFLPAIGPLLLARAPVDRMMRLERDSRPPQHRAPHPVQDEDEPDDEFKIREVRAANQITAGRGIAALVTKVT